MKPFVVLITTIAAMAAAHSQIEDPPVNGRRQLLGRALTLSARQEGDGAGPYIGPEDPGANGRRQEGDGAGPYLGPDPGAKERRQENQTPPGSFGGTVPSGGASRVKGRQAYELPDPVVAARQSESTGTEG